MKKFFKLLPFIAFAFVLLVGIIGLIIPFEFENFSYKDISPKSISMSGTSAHFEIENHTDNTYNNVEVTINFTVRTNNHSYTSHSTSIYCSLHEDENDLIFAYTPEERFSTIYKINSVKLTLDNGKSFEIYKIPLFGGVNWLFICLCIVGFFGCAICVAVSLFSKKKAEFQESNTKTFNERVREAFAPIADTINTIKQTYNESKTRIETENEKPKKVTCPYCKGKYSSTEDKCPHCGAPPEPCD